MTKRMARKTVAVLGAAAAVTGLSVVNSPTASAAGEWCNHQTCFTINTDGRFVGRIETSVWSQNIQGATIKTHIWATNGQFDLWTKSENVDAFTTYRDFKDINQDVPPGTRICVEGWQNGVSRGLPCVAVTD
ncbi:hypothetical protein AB0I77_02300 [Streptomyces sp. NPDC050619]|uniref:hypothetical protein n=1 Tax=Streptomyces sp. NPDC050619 TaxID=3157214 RepID=UPI00342DCB70